MSVTDQQVAHSQLPPNPPQRFFVRDFDLAGAEVKQAEDFLSSISEQENVQRSLSYLLVGKLRKHLGPAWRLPENVMPQEPGWIIDGDFIKVAPGSAPMRFFVGFGSGGSKYETLVQFRHWDGTQLSQPFMQFLTTGGSGASPGLIASVVEYPITIPLGVLATPFVIYSVSSKALTETAARGVEDDSERTARMIVAALADFMSQQNMLDDPPDLRVKRDWTAVKYLPNDVGDWMEDTVPGISDKEN